MSYYINASVLHKVSSEKAWWKNVYKPGDKPEASGIYRCLGCDREIAHNEGVSLPPQNHHQHTTDQGAIRWKLNVRSDTAGKGAP